MALIVDDNKRGWADSDSNHSSSSETDEEEVICLMADDSEVFDFASEKFTKEDLINALNEMVVEYKALSDSFNELKLKK